MDAFSMSGPAKNLTVIGMGKSDLDSYLNAAAKIEGRAPKPGTNPRKGLLLSFGPFQLCQAGRADGLF